MITPPPPPTSGKRKLKRDRFSVRVKQDEIFLPFRDECYGIFQHYPHDCVCKLVKLRNVQLFNGIKI